METDASKRFMVEEPSTLDPPASSLERLSAILDTLDDNDYCLGIERTTEACCASEGPPYRSVHSNTGLVSDGAAVGSWPMIMRSLTM